MSELSVNDLKPGHLYRVIDVGNFADKAFQWAVVLGVSEACDCKGVTVVPDPAADRAQSRMVGALWGVKHAATETSGAWQSDLFSRFAPICGALVLTPPPTADAALDAHHIATINTLARIRRGLHSEWGGDCCDNADAFLVRRREHDPVGVADLARAITDNADAFAACTGMLSGGLQLAARVLPGLAATF